MSRRAALALAWAASLGAALMAGALLLAPRPAALPTARASAAPTTNSARPSTTFVAVPRAGAPGLGADEMRSILREELSARDPQAGAAGDDPERTDPATTEEELAAAPPARQQSVARARAVVDAAVARGTWTEADRDALRAEQGILHGRDYLLLGRTLFPAINEGRVKPTFLGALL